MEAVMMLPPKFRSTNRSAAMMLAMAMVAVDHRGIVDLRTDTLYPEQEPQWQPEPDRDCRAKRRREQKAARKNKA